MSSIRSNIGHAYDRHTGYFTAQVPGLYFFICTAGGSDNNTHAFHSLMVDDKEISKTYTFVDGPRGTGTDVDFAPVHGVVHLSVGQRVWVMADGSEYYSQNDVTFTGFLISPDV